jgi:ribosomal protein L18
MKNKIYRKDRRSYRSKLKLARCNKGKRNIVMIGRSQRHLCATVVHPDGKTIAQIQSKQEGMKCYNSASAKKLAEILRSRLVKLKVDREQLLCHTGGSIYGGVVRDFMEELKK